jgi:hypothetical protein
VCACRPSKEEAAEYVDLTDNAALLRAKMQDTCLQSQQFAERLVRGAVVMVQTPQQTSPHLSVVLGLEAAIKVLLPACHVKVFLTCRMHHPAHTQG